MKTMCTLSAAFLLATTATAQAGILGGTSASVGASVGSGGASASAGASVGNSASASAGASVGHGSAAAGVTAGTQNVSAGVDAEIGTDWDLESGSVSQGIVRGRDIYRTARTRVIGLPVMASDGVVLGEVVEIRSSKKACPTFALQPTKSIASGHRRVWVQSNNCAMSNDLVRLSLASETFVNQINR